MLAHAQGDGLAASCLNTHGHVAQSTRVLVGGRCFAKKASTHIVAKLNSLSGRSASTSNVMQGLLAGRSQMRVRQRCRTRAHCSWCIQIVDALTLTGLASRSELQACAFQEQLVQDLVEVHATSLATVAGFHQFPRSRRSRVSLQAVA